MSTPTFPDLGVPADLVRVLERRNIVDPTPIQAAVLPDLITRRDVLGRAPTGSGKTLAFGIPAVLATGRAQPHMPLTLMLSPTRELAEQIRKELEPLAAARKRTVSAVYGGVGVGPQVRALRNGVDILVATPGRLIDLIDQGEVSLHDVRQVVIDEADRMADMGFLPDVRRLLDDTVARRQTVLFSATLGPEVQTLTNRYQDDPITHQVGAVEPDLSLVEHRFVRTRRESKIATAAHFIGEAGPTIVFCRTRYGVDRVARQLKGAGAKTSHIHGNRSQNQRDSALKAFVDGKVDALVATDVAARGIHVDGVACVIHFDPPEDDKAYVHRSGRTARAGASGTVISFVNTDQEKQVRRMAKQIGVVAEFEDAPTVDLTPAPAATETDGAKTAKTAKSRSGGEGQRSGGDDRRQSGPRRQSGQNRRPTSSSSGSGAQKRSTKGKPTKAVKKKHQKKVAQTAKRQRNRSAQKRHAAKQRNRSASNHRGRR